MKRAAVDHAGQPTTVTANNRLARQLLAEFSAQAEQEGIRAWERAPILPWGAWLRGLYEELLLAGHEGRAHLSPLAEALLWEEIVADEMRAERMADGLVLPLIDLSGVARSIQGAWRLLCDHQLSLRALAGHETLEVRLLARCCATFERRCHQSALMDSGRLAARVGSGFEGNELPLPSRVLFYGFDELLPMHASLITTLERRGVVVERGAAAPCEGSRVRRVVLDDGDVEVRAAVRWASARLATTPDQRIAIVAPQLAAQRERLLQELEESLEPHSLLPGQHPQRTLFNFSLGEALSAAPLVHDALLWWRLAAGASLSLGELLVLLRSPFCADAEAEGEARALFALELCRWGRPEMDLEALRALIERRVERAEVTPSRWIRALNNFAQGALALAHTKQGAAGWRRALRDLLERVGWPGERSVDSDEYQQIKRLGDELDGLAALDLVCEAGFDLKTILRWLERAIEGALFQPESLTDAPLQVLGQLEAAGQRFDSVWLLGLDEAHWPAPGDPNAFLPLTLQRQHHMPHATPQLSLERAQGLTRDLLASAKEVIVSTPRREGDVECMPSPLIADLEETTFEILANELGANDLGGADLRARAAHTFSHGEIERVEDLRAPALAAPVELRGGSAIFADQAACPFRAYARRRLRADPPNQPEAGLDAITSGKIVHHALELLWEALESHARLAAMTEEQRVALIDRAVGDAIERERKRIPEVFQPRLTKLFAARLRRLLFDWLELESERAPFRVLAREARSRLTVGGVSCNVQVDRIDELDDGTQVFLDYKTGKSASSAGWLRERIEEPQLPLYTLAAASKISGVALAKVRRDKARGFDGLWASEQVFPPKAQRGGKAKSASRKDELSLEERLARWRVQLEELAEELLSGWAAVSPMPRACEYCELGMLCRRWELDLMRDEDDEGPEAQA